MNKIGVYLILFLLLTIPVFEFVPAVEYYRYVVPAKFSTGDYTCKEILDSRPWYSTFNYLRWVFLLIPPIFVFSIKPETSKWNKFFLTIIIIIIIVPISTESGFLSSEIRNAPFKPIPEYPNMGLEHMNECKDYSSGRLSYVETLILVGVYDSIYIGIWWGIKILLYKIIKLFYFLAGLHRNG